jgi:hypothetical protein
MKLTEELTTQTMTKKRVAVMVVALCVVAGVTAGTLGLMPTGQTSAGPASGGSGASADASAAAGGGSTTTGGSAAASDNAAGGDATNASDGSAKRVSDCDLIDIDGHNNTVSVNISNNTTGDGVTIQYHCGADNATTLDHDVIDVDGNNNSVTVVVRAENGTITFGEDGNAASSDGFHVALHCRGGTAADCDAVDIDGHNNSVTLIVRSDEGQTVHQFGSNSSDTTRTETG